MAHTHTHGKIKKKFSHIANLKTLGETLESYNNALYCNNSWDPVNV